MNNYICSGIVQVCDILRKNHPIRVHKDLFEKYLKFLTQENICIGKTKLFLTEAQYKLLQEVKYAILIQSYMRRYIVIRRNFFKVQKSLCIQSYFRMMIKRTEFENMKKSATLLQTKLKEYTHRKHDKKMAQMSEIDDLKNANKSTQK